MPQSREEFKVALQSELPTRTARTLTDEQMDDLYNLLGETAWKSHQIDAKATIGLWRWRYYFRFVAGRDRRKLSRREQQLGLQIKIMILVRIAGISTLVGLLLIYLGKSGPGIDVIPNFSFGI